MSNIPNDRLYTQEHEWAQADGADGSLITVGITEYAQSALGDIVMVELPEIGDTFSANDSLGALESPKSVSDVFAPFDGEIAAVNEALEDEPESVNDDPYGAGWLVKIRVEDRGVLADLMDAGAYKALLAGLEDA